MLASATPHCASQQVDISFPAHYDPSSFCCRSHSIEMLDPGLSISGPGAFCITPHCFERRVYCRTV